MSTGPRLAFTIVGGLVAALVGFTIITIEAKGPGYYVRPWAWWVLGLALATVVLVNLRWLTGIGHHPHVCELTWQGPTGLVPCGRPATEQLVGRWACADHLRAFVGDRP